MNEKQAKRIVEKYTKQFHKARLRKIKEIKLAQLLKKNPYLYKIRGISTPEDYIRSTLPDFITSSEETVFGQEFFEPLGLEISNGKVSLGKGTDFSVETANKITVYSFKSGTNVQNASAMEKQGQEFTETTSRLTKMKKSVEGVRISGYGTTNSPPTKKRPYRIVAGQAAWEELTGDPDFYKKIVKYMPEESDTDRDNYTNEFENAVERLTKKFEDEYTTNDGSIDWEKIVDITSKKRKKKSQKKKARKRIIKKK